MLSTERAAQIRRRGETHVDSSIVCVLTRFGLASPRHLLPTYRDYRTITQQIARSEPPGLLKSAFLFEGLSACYSLSLWDGPDAWGYFGTDVLEHVDAARRVLGRLAFEPERGPELWSTKWRLVSVSHNLNWGDFDLREAISQA
jgi:hypothetical protein